jgi:lipopolysaccharide/colanic/teichoic acid biosynthesis glycosyltransferase
MIRILDVFFSIFGLLLLSPILFIISLIIQLESKGGIFYLQERIGKNGIPFKLFKFRSMAVGSDSKGLLTVGMNDARITKSGQFIRRYKIDELPQFINVLKGEMSLVGPRPEVKKYVDLYTETQRKVLSVKPGITDLASIEFSNENELLEKQSNPEEYYIREIMPKKIEFNMLYIENPNLINYFKLILKTGLKIIRSIVL